MNAFTYVTAQTPESAVQLVRDNGRFIAGGIDLLGEMKEAIASPKTLVNVKALPVSTIIQTSGSPWIVGANVTLAALAAHAEIKKTFPGLAEAALDVGSPQIRNVATVGGNLAQHSRCWYYRHRDVKCRKKGGSTCYARQSESKYHSLFTGNMCISPCVSNLGIALAALDAKVVIQRASGVQTLSIPDLYADAWRTPTAHNSLRPDDLILRVEVPVVANRRSTYLQLGEKGDFDWALVSCAASAVVQGNVVRGARVVLGAVSPTPWQVDAANASLEGKALTPELAAAAADLLLREARPFDDNGYKIPIAKALVRRALLKLVA